jgi:hypothetical protein
MADRRIGDRRSPFRFGKFTFHDNRIVVTDGPPPVCQTLYDGPERRHDEVTDLLRKGLEWSGARILFTGFDTLGGAE